MSATKQAITGFLSGLLSMIAALALPRFVTGLLLGAAVYIVAINVAREMEARADD